MTQSNTTNIFLIINNEKNRPDNKQTIPFENYVTLIEKEKHE